MPRNTNFEPVQVTEQEAFDFYRQMEKPTIVGTERHFREQGKRISRATLERWSKASNWNAAIRTAQPRLSSDPIGIDEELRRFGPILSNDQSKGLAFRLGVRIAQSLDKLQLNDTGQLERAVAIYEKLATMDFGASSEGRQKPGVAVSEDGKTYQFAVFKTAERK